MIHVATESNDERVQYNVNLRKISVPTRRLFSALGLNNSFPKRGRCPSITQLICLNRTSLITWSTVDFVPKIIQILNGISGVHRGPISTYFVTTQTKK
jgi:hypothetical protein